jgi:hypothetical protein
MSSVWKCQWGSRERPDEVLVDVVEEVLQHTTKEDRSLLYFPVATRIDGVERLSATKCLVRPGLIPPLGHVSYS